MSKIPHIGDNVLLALGSETLVYLDEKDNSCSYVIRYAPSVRDGVQLPLRFEKRSKGNDYQVVYENYILSTIQSENIRDVKIVKRLEYIQRGDDYVIVTEDAGVDAYYWQFINLLLHNNQRQYDNIFCHPLALLHFIKGSLLALQSIHKHGLLHCDIRLDQICIPFTKNNDNIKLHFDDIRLIDFGIAIWHMTPVASRNPVRFTSQNTQDYRRAAKTLIRAGDYQHNLRQQDLRYDFNILMTQIDCAVDLYALGVMLDELEIKQCPADRQAWRSFEYDYQDWVSELLALSDKTMPFGYNVSSLPHARYLQQIDSWIDRVSETLGYTANQIDFRLQSQTARKTPQAEPSPMPTSLELGLNKPQPTPTPPSKIKDTPKAISGSEQDAWQRALSDDTLESYNQYLKKYPDGVFFKLAQDKIKSLRNRENQLWQNACTKNTIDAYQYYLKMTKVKKYTKEARAKIAYLEKSETENELWNKALSANTIEVYQEYIKKYPNGAYATVARNLIDDRDTKQKQTEQMERDEKVYLSAVHSNTLKDYENYLKRFPSGRYAQSAKNQITRLSEKQSQNQKNSGETVIKKELATEVQKFLPKMKDSHSLTEIFMMLAKKHGYISMGIISILLNIVPLFVISWWHYEFAYLMFEGEILAGLSLLPTAFMMVTDWALLTPILTLIFCYVWFFFFERQEELIDFLGFLSIQIVIFFGGTALCLTVIPNFFSMTNNEFDVRNAIFFSAIYCFIFILVMNTFVLMKYKHMIIYTCSVLIALFLAIYIAIIDNPLWTRPITENNIVHNKERGATIDKANKLIWQNCALGQQWNGNTCVGEPKAMSVEQANKVIKNINAKLGKEYWRLPTSEELLTIMFCHDNDKMFDEISTNLWYRPVISTYGTCRQHINVLYYEYQNKPEDVYFVSSTPSIYGDSYQSLGFYYYSFSNSYEKKVHDTDKGFVKLVHRFE